MSTEKIKINKYYYSLKNHLKKTGYNDKFVKLLTELDKKEDDKFKLLFLISLYCTVFYHYYGKRNNQLGLDLTFSPSIKCNNFKILAYEGKYTDDLLSTLATFFNTDAILTYELATISGRILHDLHNMRFVMITD
jgi:hypothetical protein